MKPAFNSFEPHHLGANWPAYWVKGHNDEPARWLVYFDLLGFTKLVEGNIADAVDTYFKMRELLRNTFHHQHHTALRCGVIHVPAPWDHFMNRAHANNFAGG